MLRQIKEEMTKIRKSSEEHEGLKNELTELKEQMTKEKEEAEKKHTELKRKFTVLETDQKEVECVSIAFFLLIYRYMYNCLFLVNIPVHV
jgi:lipid II:glycine glycyltransferase (peptidoglycan interpeptide bridge formation enzyme)